MSTTEEPMEFRLEVVVVPVADVDRAKAFYTEKLGFNLDVDTEPGGGMRVVQMTPPGSGCSITVGTGLGSMEPGSMRGLQLVVDDIRAARELLASRGVDVGDVQVFESGGPRPAREDDTLDYAGFLFFKDPDGNAWAVQQISRNPNAGGSK
jgi:catechol 2,3-dioxygenase-like lactoylglutathione lyase family enzyme